MMTGAKYMKIDPESIQGFFDFVPVDGTLPVDRFAQANLWRELMAGMAQIPQVAMQYDLGAIFAYTAKLAGAKSVDQFKIQVVADDQLEERVRRGDVVPIGGGNGPSPGNEEQYGRVAEPGQISGMGASG
jgi:hypothetical protein